MKFFLAPVFLLAFVAADAVLAQQAETVKNIIKNLEKCVRADKTQVNKCFSDFFTEMRPEVTVGIEDMNVPPLDPMFIDRADFPKDSALIVGEAYFYNMSVIGTGTYIIKNVAVDIPKQIITSQLYFPRIVVDGEYHFDGNLLVLPVTGQGRLLVNITDINGTMVMHIERDGTKFKLDEVYIDYDAKEIGIRLENLYGGQEVGEAINKLINDNSQQVNEELKYMVNVKLGEGYKNVFANIVNQVSPELLLDP